MESEAQVAAQAAAQVAAQVAAQHLLDVFEGSFPAITLEHAIQLYHNKGFIVVLGKETAQEPDAQVFVCSSVEEVRQICVNRKWKNTFVLSWTEAFGKPDLLLS